MFIFFSYPLFHFQFCNKLILIITVVYCVEGNDTFVSVVSTKNFSSKLFTFNNVEGNDTFVNVVSTKNFFSKLFTFNNVDSFLSKFVSQSN